MAFLQWLLQYVGGLPLLAIWGSAFGILLACGFGLPVPEDITLILCGYATYLHEGNQTPHAWAMACASLGVGLAGVLIGDGTMFWLGRRWGTDLAKVWPFRSIFGNGRLERTRLFLQAHGAKVLFTARFTPGLRSVVFFSSGTLGIPATRFLFYDGLAALLSVPALVLSSWYWGDRIEDVIKRAQRAEHGLLLIIGVVAVILLLKWWLGKRRQQREAAALAVQAASVPEQERE
jgi:membrane protein DedA with SNARE-associated domain